MRVCAAVEMKLACLGGDSTLLSAATAGHKSKGGRLAAGSLLGFPLNAVLLTCTYFIDCFVCFFPSCGGGLAWCSEDTAAQTGA